MNKIFTICVTVSGQLHASFVFEDNNKKEAWLAKHFPLLEEEYGKLTTTEAELDGLEVGEKCP